MRYLDECAKRCAADALGGRIGREQFGKLPLELYQLVFKRIKRGVRNLLPVKDMIEIPMMV